MSTKDIIKLGITLMIVGVISATVLSVTHGITAPIIEEQRIQEIENNMREFFSDAEEVEIDEREEREFYYAYYEGERIGVATSVAGSGYGGDIDMMVAMDMDGVIKGVSILYHEETPGIGDVIEDESFKNNFAGISPEDAIQEEVDIITGSTQSVTGAKEGVKEGRQVLADFLELEMPAMEEVED